MAQITDKQVIEAYFNKGHFDVLTPDGQRDDYDTAIPDYYARKHSLGACLDSNGSESLIDQINSDGTVIIEFLVYEREFEHASWNEKDFRTEGKLVIDENNEPLYHIKRLEEFL